MATMIMNRKDTDETDKDVKDEYKEFMENSNDKIITDPDSGNQFKLRVPKEFCANSAPMCRVLKTIYNLSTITKIHKSEKNKYLPIFMKGETGVGKTQLAEIFHRNSDRAGKSFKTLNCAAMPLDMLESELFGSVPGAFTNATNKPGLFETTNGGTLFLDEIGDLRIEHQAKLLTAISEKKGRRLGENKDRKYDVRIISATNKDLKKLVQEGEFRNDFYYRLIGFSIHVPPLRDREEDIIEISEKILERINSENALLQKLKFGDDVIHALKSFPFHGNVRQLKLMIERAVIDCLSKNIKIITVRSIRDTSQEEARDFGIDNKSEIVRFYEKYFNEINYKTLSSNDLAVGIAANYQDNTFIDLMKAERILLKMFGLPHQGIDVIDNRTRDLIIELKKKLDSILNFKTPKKEDLLNYLEDTDDLSIFKDIEKIKENSISRLRESGLTCNKIGEMLDISAQAIHQKTKK